MCELLQAVDASSTTSGPTVEGASITRVLVVREVMSWQSRLGRIDTLVGIFDADGMPVDCSQLIDRAVGDDSLGVAVTSLDNLITSKAFAGRRKDAEALPELRRIRSERRCGAS